MTNEIIYICKCGCELPKAGIYRSRIGYTTRILCREHKEPVIGRKQICMDCGEWYMLKDRGPGSIRCPECAEVEKNRRRRKRLNIIPKPSGTATVGWSVDKRGDYCRWLPECLAQGDFKCSKCGRFEGIYFGWDPGKWLVPGVRL